MDRPTAFIIINYITIIVTIIVTIMVTVIFTIITVVTMVVIVISSSRDAFSVQRWIFLLGRQVQFPTVCSFFSWQRTCW